MDTILDAYMIWGNDGVTEQVTVFEQERFYGYLKPFRSEIVTGVW